jgi:ubiquinone/menaquinone biosynthesis C-methylase UbiE
MAHEDEKNARRFEGFADIYDSARPALPLCAIELICLYLGKTPGRVVDMGCGTGLSTLVWANHCAEVVGVEPSADMLSIARAKAAPGVSFIQAFSHDTGIEPASADAVVCSQSFHWMEPASTLAEVSRILAPGGVFASVDCDWPPVCGTEPELAFNRLMDEASRIEDTEPSLLSASTKWDKSGHLHNIRQSGHFRDARELVFSHTESCTAERLVGLALSQGGLQSVLKACPERIQPEIDRFREAVRQAYGDMAFPIDFGYRMRIGVK